MLKKRHLAKKQTDIEQQYFTDMYNYIKDQKTKSRQTQDSSEHVETSKEINDRMKDVFNKLSK